MVYVTAGLVASALMLLYRCPASTSSSLRQRSVESEMLMRRLTGGGARTLSRIGLYGSFMVLASVAALRYGIGTDYWARNAPLFDQVRQGDYGDYEVGFVLINRLVAAFTEDYQWLFATMSFLTIGLFYRFIVRMSLSPAISVYLYVFGGFYLEAFNLVQQGLAIAILLNTIELAIRRRLVGFVVLSLLAATVHSSAIVWFAACPLIWIRAGRFAQLSLAVGGAITIMLVPQLLGSLASQVAPHYAWYFDSNYGVVRALDPSVLVVAFLVFVACVALVRRGKSLDRYADTIITILGVNVVILVATISVAYVFLRLNYYFAPIQILAVPLVLSVIRDLTLQKLSALTFMAVYAIAFYYQFIVWNAHGVVPYDSILSR